MIINKFIGDVFVNDVDIERVEYTNDKHQSEYTYRIVEVWNESYELITDYDEKLLRREIDAILKNEF